MTENGLLTNVRWEYDGTITAAAAAAGDAYVLAAYPAAIAPDSDIWVSGTGPYRVLSVEATEDDTPGAVGVEPPLAEAVEEGEPVVPDAGGAPARVWTAEVVLIDGATPVEIPLTA